MYVHWYLRCLLPTNSEVAVATVRAITDLAIIGGEVDRLLLEPLKEGLRREYRKQKAMEVADYELLEKHAKNLFSRAQNVLRTGIDAGTQLKQS